MGRTFQKKDGAPNTQHGKVATKKSIGALAKIQPTRGEKARGPQNIKKVVR